MSRAPFLGWWRRRRDREAEAARELRDHLDLEAEELRARGGSREDSANAARRTLGNTTLIQEEIHAVWTSTFVEQLCKDFVYAFRTLRRAPTFTLAALGSLVLGIGANTAVFSVVNGVLLRPLPYTHPERLVMVYDSFQQQGMARGPGCVADFLDWKSRTTEIFESIDATAGSSLTITGDGEAEQLTGRSVTGTFFQTLGVTPLLGRTFSPGDDRPGGPQVVMLSESLWRRRFHADPAIVGKGITLNGRPFAIAGVLPAAFRFMAEADAWTPLVLDPPGRRGPFFLQGVGRLKPGVTVERASAVMQSIAQRVERDNARDYTRLRFPVVDLREAAVGDVRSLLWLLSGAVFFVLLIAVANVASLMLARATSRRREIAIRLSTGAGRVHLIRQLMAESVLLSVTGGALGVGFAQAAISALRNAAPADSLVRLNELGIDASVCAFTLLASVASAIFFGLGPALSASSISLSESLRDGGRAGESRGAGRMRRVLVVSQIALSMLLVIGAGLLMRSFRQLEHVELGFDAPPDRILTMRVTPSSLRYRAPVPPAGAPTQPNRPLANYWDQLAERVRSLAGVEAASLSMSLPPNRIAFTDGFEVEGRPFPPGSRPSAVPVIVAGSEYLKTLEIRLLRGRWFDSRDHLDSPRVTVISDAMARQYFPGEDPVGKHLRHGFRSSGNPFMEIVGVVRNVKYEGLHAETGPAYYEAATQMVFRPMWLIVRSRAAGAAGLATELRREIAALDADVPVDRVATMSEVLTDSVSSPRFRTILIAAFAAAALFMAAMGIYGTIAYSVAQRSQEIGVRMALGSTRARVVQMVVGQGSRLAAAGIALGLVGALVLTMALSHYVEPMLFGVTPKDPIAFGLAALILGAVAVAASVLPALRAARIDPVRALRQE